LIARATRWGKVARRVRAIKTIGFHTFLFKKEPSWFFFGNELFLSITIPFLPRGSLVIYKDNDFF
jgi:hypothetical protein